MITHYIFIMPDGGKQGDVVSVSWSEAEDGSLYWWFNAFTKKKNETITVVEI